MDTWEAQNQIVETEVRACVCVCVWLRPALQAQAVNGQWKEVSVH